MLTPSLHAVKEWPASACVAHVRPTWSRDRSHETQVQAQVLREGAKGWLGLGGELACN